MAETIDQPTLYIATVVVLVGLSALGVGVSAVTHAPTTSPAPGGDAAFNVTDDGTRYTVHPSKIRQGCLGGTDCIPAIDDPSFQPADQADWLADEDLIIGITINGEPRAYPLRILTVHEIVNDDVTGRPVAVTYCPLCRSGLVFDRQLNGSTLTFGVSGKLLNANLVMYDRQTETYWSQLTGKAVVGPLVPSDLTILPSTITTWGQWQESHPTTTVLSRDTGIYPPSTYGSSPYSGFAESERVGFGVDRVDDRLHPKTIVYGVTIGNTSRAYPEDVVTDEDVINDAVAGVPVLIVEDQRTGGVKVYAREVNGDPIRFELEDGVLRDEAGGGWTFNGTAVAGPYEGAQLSRLNSHGIYWFAWSEFHPGTAIYQETNRST